MSQDSLYNSLTSSQIMPLASSLAGNVTLIFEHEEQYNTAHTSHIFAIHPTHFALAAKMLKIERVTYRFMKSSTNVQPFPFY